MESLEGKEKEAQALLKLLNRSSQDIKDGRVISSIDFKKRLENRRKRLEGKEVK